MSFFRKKKNEVDFTQQEKAIDKEIVVKKKLAQQSKAEEKPELRVGEVRVTNIETESKPIVSDETSRERNRLKYKDTSGLVTSPESNNYPTFNVFYLGRIPTNSEYGMAAVESPVDQLCRLRDKQKLPRVALTFDTEGLTVKELSSSIFSKSKTKKDGIDLTVPLHYITYGVASEGHPLVFACITRMADDDIAGEDGLPVLMLYAFLCDKTDTAQQITYWQLQAYIEAYEELKRKKILRNRRKQVLGSRKTPKGPRSKQTIPEDAPAEFERPLPMYGNEPPPEMEEHSNDEEDIEELYAKPKKGFKVKNKGYKKSKSKNGPSEDSTEEDANSDIPENLSPEALSPTELTRPSSVTSEDSIGGSRDVAFEKRITEMNELMAEVDAEKLKKLMISNHASLAREIYFTKTATNRNSTDEDAHDEDV